MAARDIKILEEPLTLVAFSEPPPQFIPNQSSIIRFGFIKKPAKKCEPLPNGGFQLSNGKGADIRFASDMQTAMISWEAKTLGLSYEYRRVRWVPVCHLQAGSTCEDVRVEIWAEPVGEEFPDEDEATNHPNKKIPWLPRAHLAAWSKGPPAGANNHIRMIDVEQIEQGLKCNGNTDPNG